MSIGTVPALIDGQYHLLGVERGPLPVPLNLLRSVFAVRVICHDFLTRIDVCWFLNHVRSLTRGSGGLTATSSGGWFGPFVAPTWWHCDHI
jgi:hypothetical protein